MAVRFSICSLLFSMGWAQLFYSPVDVATAGAALGGKLGTHAIQSNPALLGLQSGENMATAAIETVMVAYRIRLAVSENVQDVMILEDQLIKTGPMHNYIVQKTDSVYALETQDFTDILSASNFASSLPSEYKDHEIIPDTTREIIHIPRKHHLVQLIATAKKDTLKAFKKRNRKLLKGLKSEVVFIDSLYKYRVGGFPSKLEAQTLKDSIVSMGVSPDAFIVLDQKRHVKKDVPRFTMTIPLGFTFHLGNDVLDADWINTYAGADMVENPGLKTSLLASIPSGGIMEFSGLNTSILSLSYDSYGFSLLDLDIYQKAILPKPLFQAVFKGVFFNQPVDISDFDTRVLAANASVFSFGKQLKTLKSPFKTYIGFGLRILSGGFGEVQSFSGTLTTSTDSVVVESDMHFAYGFPAAGIGLDMGLYSQVNEQLSAQISIMGIGGSLRSSEVEVIHNIQEIHLSNLDIEKLQNYDNTQIDSLKKTFTILDTTYLDKAKRVPVPARINLGFSYRPHQLVMIHGALQQLVQTEFIGDIDPRISIGAEFFPDRFLPLRIGIAGGGMDGFYAGAGLGLKMGPIHINLGVSQSGGLENSASAINMAADIRVFF